jgi:hypothetical protein
MKTYKTVKSEYQGVDKTFCDWCKEEIIRETIYQVKDVSLHSREGYMYPEGGNVQRFDFDLCVECFHRRLVPLLKENGVNPTITVEE